MALDALVPDQRIDIAVLKRQIFHVLQVGLCSAARTLTEVLADISEGM